MAKSLSLKSTGRPLVILKTFNYLVPTGGSTYQAHKTQHIIYKNNGNIIIININGV